MNINQIVVGDTLDFATEVPDYTPADGWTLKYRLVPRVSGSAILLTSAASEGKHRVQVGPTTTATWAGGEYSWASWVEKTGARYSVAQGQVTLLPDPAVTTAPRDNRSFARKLLEQIETALLNTGSSMRLEYTIGDRTMKYESRAAVMAARANLLREIAAEDNATRLANGLGTRNTIRIRG